MSSTLALYISYSGTIEREGSLQWVWAKDGAVPCIDKAVKIGKSGITGETLYCGRVEWEGNLLPGKVVRTHQVCYVSFKDTEKGDSFYEVLVNNDPDNSYLFWMPAANGKVPRGAVIGGYVGSNKEILYIARASPPPERQGIHGGKVLPSSRCAYIPYGGTEFSCKNYEVLCVVNSKS